MRSSKQPTVRDALRRLGYHDYEIDIILGLDLPQGKNAKRHAARKQEKKSSRRSKRTSTLPSIDESPQPDPTIVKTGEEIPPSTNENTQIESPTTEAPIYPITREVSSQMRRRMAYILLAAIPAVIILLVFMFALPTVGFYG